jgi:hypothetical protein
VLSAEPLAGVCVISTFPERRRWGSKERAQRDAGGSAHQVQEELAHQKEREQHGQSKSAHLEQHHHANIQQRKKTEH